MNKIEHSEKQIDIESDTYIEKIRATYSMVKCTDCRKNSRQSECHQNVIEKGTLCTKEQWEVDVCNEFCENIVTANRTRQLLTYSRFEWMSSLNK